MQRTFKTLVDWETAHKSVEVTGFGYGKKLGYVAVDAIFWTKPKKHRHYQRKIYTVDGSPSYLAHINAYIILDGYRVYFTRDDVKNSDGNYTTEYEVYKIERDN